MKKYILFFCLFIFLGLVKGQACTERVNGGSFSYWDGNVWGNGPVYWETRNYPSADYGFVFDLTFLDNAFDLEINGVWIHPNKLEFHHGCVTQGCTTANVTFADGSYYGYGGIPNVYSFGTVSANTPIVRVVISATGIVSLYGSKYNGGPLLPLVVTDGLLQNVTWNTTGNNTVRFWQPRLGPTGMAGVAYGLKNAVPVTINTQPIGTTYCQNAAASLLSVAATGGTGLTYQWYSNTVNNNTSGTLISGATSSTYTPPTTTAGTRYYYVRVTNANGCNTTSNTATVIVNAPPAITSQPTGATYCQNITASALSTTATGTGLTYQWYSNTVNNNTSGTSISGATSSTYVPPTATVGTRYYYVRVANSSGCNTTSNTATIIVNTIPTITVQPTGATYCQDVTASALSTTATGTGLTYQWYSNTVNNNTSGTSISGATSSTYVPPTTTAGTRYYYVRVSNANGCSAISSAVSIITDDNCQCYKPAVITGTSLETKHGISALGRAGVDNGNWPMVRKGAWTALESKTKGFVINRIPTTAQVNALPNPVEGMMVYDEEADCLKIYTTTNGTTSWQCFNTQACPDN